VENDKDWQTFMRTMKSVAQASLRDGKPLLQHVSIRVKDLDAAERLMTQVFGLDRMIRYPEGFEGYPGERRISFVWLGQVFFELIEQASPPTIGFDTGVGLPIGHLNEIGYFVADLDAELERLKHLGWVVQHPIACPGQRMAKVDTDPPSGIPIEIIELTEELDALLGDETTVGEEASGRAVSPGKNEQPVWWGR
jgi:catechol 2,3-dioxygenase-like lactoylglutathione lyase family enzyme